MSEDRYGFRVTIWGSTGRTTSYRGWSEGDPNMNTTLKSTVIKGVATNTLKAIVGGGMGVSAIFAAAGAAGTAIGGGISAIVMAGLDKVMRNRAGLALSKGNITIGITIAGDFKASYKIQTGKDLDALPSLLAIIPATFNKNGKAYAMGDAVIKYLVTDQTAACMGGKSVNIRYTVDV